VLTVVSGVGIALRTDKASSVPDKLIAIVEWHDLKDLPPHLSFSVSSLFDCRSVMGDHRN